MFESGGPIAHIARDLGVPSETLRKYVRQLEADEGLRPRSAAQRGARGDQGVAQGVYELRRADEILKAASVCFAIELDEDRTK